MPKNKITAKELRRREADLTAVLDAKNLVDLQDRRPDVVERLNPLVEVGYTAGCGSGDPAGQPANVGRVEICGKCSAGFDNWG